MGKTSIEWTQHVWNCVRGCSMAEGSEAGGCKNCYAARQAARGLPGMNSPTTGEPFAVMRDSGPRWTGKVELIEHMLDVPLRRCKPTTYFVNSMSDLFHESLPIAAQERIFRVMLSATQHTYQILTKRADLMAERVPQIYERIMGPPQNWRVPPWIWLGVSVEDQPTADERIPLLLQTPAAVRFISAEPLLGPVNLTYIEFRSATWYDALQDHDGFGLLGAAHQKLDWCIVGGESGPGARPCDVAWIRSIVGQCAAAGVKVFVKQLGTNVIDRNDAGFNGDTLRSWPMDSAWSELDSGYQGAPVRLLLDDRKAGNPAEWPLDLRVRQMPEAHRG